MFGEPNPDRLLRTMPAGTFVEWAAYAALEPFGPQQDHWRSAMVASVLANIHRGKQQRAFGIEDFLPASMSESDHGQSPRPRTRRR